MKSAIRWFLVSLLSGLSPVVPLLAQGESAPPGEDLCAPKGVTIPFDAASPRAWNTWVSNTDLNDTYCHEVAVPEIRSRVKKNSQGELEVTFKVTTYTKPGHDKKVDAIIEVLVADRVLKSTTIGGIDAEEKKNGHGSGFLVLPADLLPADGTARLRISLEAVDN